MQELLKIDEQLASTIFNFISLHPLLTSIAKILGVGLVYLVPFVLLLAWFTNSRKDALKAGLAGILAWEGFSKLIASLVDRTRPAESLIGVKELIFHRPDNSFPSDHAAFIMAVAVSFYLSGQKKLAYFVLIIALLTGFTRIAIGVHYPADIIVGFLIGTIVAYLIQLINQPLERLVLEPIIAFARRFKL